MRSKYAQLLAALEPLYAADGVFGKRLAAITIELLDPETTWEDVQRLRGEYRGLREVLDRVRSLARDEEEKSLVERAKDEDHRRAEALERHGLPAFRR